MVSYPGVPHLPGAHANRFAMDGAYLALVALTRLAVVWESGLSNQSILVGPAVARQAGLYCWHRAGAGVDDEPGLA